MDKSDITGAAVVAGIVGAAGAAAAGIGALILFEKTLPRPKGTSDDIIEEFADPEKMQEYMVNMAPVGEWMEKQSLEDIYIIARDGIRLHALYLAAAEKSDRLVILHHGFTSKAADNSVHAKFFHDMGYEVLMLDLRAHGESEGEYVGFGILDRYDTLKWVQYAKNRFGEDTRIVLHGTSMGAATVLMALGLDEIQNSVSAVIADCAYTSPAEIFAHVIKTKYHIPSFPVMQINGLMSKRKVGYTFDEYSTKTALQVNRKVPVLLIHGAEDKFVPTQMSRENYEVCQSKKQLLIVENAGHGSSVFEDEELYEATERAFLDEALGSQEGSVKETQYGVPKDTSEQDI